MKSHHLLKEYSIARFKKKDCDHLLCLWNIGFKLTLTYDMDRLSNFHGLNRCCDLNYSHTWGSH